MNPQSHWDQVYRTKQPGELSWHQRDAGLSLALIRELAPDRASPIIDVGGGVSPLVDAARGRRTCRRYVARCVRGAW